MKTDPAIIAALRKPFPADRIEWRLAMCGEKSDGSIWARCLAYIDNRAAMERLDDVFGASWSQEERFHQIGEETAVCTVSIHIGEREGYPARTVTGSCAVEANGDIDKFKSAASGAMKRAVVNLGIGRYLYDLPEAWANVTSDGAYAGQTKNKTKFRWNPPSLPAWAVPAGDTSQSRAVEEDEQPSHPVNNPPYSQGSSAAPSRPAAPAPSAAPADPSDPWSVQVHFGKNKGKALRDLPENTLKWYLKEWFPKPFGEKQIISRADKELRAALDKIAGVETDPGPAPLQVPEDDGVPF